jgi:hypothetical protein
MLGLVLFRQGNHFRAADRGQLREDAVGAVAEEMHAPAAAPVTYGKLRTIENQPLFE